MMDHTDRHCRYFFRLLAPDVGLYTEMVMAQAVIHGDRERLLDFDASEHPLAIQLGGSEPAQLARAASIATEYGYDEINLNIGCPSDRVRSGGFGACLMIQPELVARCVSAMREATELPVTVKTRTGIDDHDDYPFLKTFVSTVAAAGCETFVVHARKAILSGLSPRQNRVVPPLNYSIVRRLKQDFPELNIVVNGGISELAAVSEHLETTDGVMIGRKACADPRFLSAIQAGVLNELSGRVWSAPDRETVIRQMAEYAEQQMQRGVRLHHITRHLLGLFVGMPGARRWRRYLSEHAVLHGAGPEVLVNSLSYGDSG